MNRSSVRRRFYVSHIAGRTGRNALGPKLHLQTNVMFCGLLHDNRRECVDERHARRFENDVRLGQGGGLCHAEGAHGRHRNGQAV